MKTLRTDESIDDLLAELEMYKELLHTERMFAEKQEKQINKMKCCSNCRHNYFDNEEIRHCDVLNQHQMVVFKKCDKWELAE